MLGDVLGILIAFISVLLFFGLLVTTFVQMAQASFKLRGRNLLYGLAVIVRQQLDGADTSSDSNAEKNVNWRAAKAIARNVLEYPAMTKLDWLQYQGEVKGKLSDWLKDPGAMLTWLRGPGASWVPPEKLDEDSIVKAAEGIRPIDSDKAKAIIEDFSRSEAALSKRFAFNMRIWSVLLAIVLSAVFQLSVFDVINGLTNSSTERLRYEALGEQALAGASEAQVHFTIWPCGLEFYYGDEKDSTAICFGNGDVGDQEDESHEANDVGVVHWRRIIGVILMGILASLGAPFWFDILQNVVGLRDRLAPRRDATASQQS